MHVLEYDESRTNITPCSSIPIDGVITRLQCGPARSPDLVLCSTKSGQESMNERVSIISMTKTSESYQIGQRFQQMNSLLWDESENVFICDSTGIYMYDVSRNQQTTSSTTRPFRNACIDPHQPHVVCGVSGKSIHMWDSRTNRCEIFYTSLFFQITCMDINPNIPFRYVTGSEDGRISLWDIRNIGGVPIKSFDAHNHFVTCLKYNQLHDEYLISSGTDCGVNLWKCPDKIQREPLMPKQSQTRRNSYSSNSSFDSPVSVKGVVRPKRTTSPLICKYTRHEDSVYDICWSYASPWVFGSVSYSDGLVMVNAVPINEKFNAN